MHYQSYQLNIDLNQYPTLESKQPDEITIGDIHGNALLLLNLLIRYGVLSFEKSDYLNFVRIYKLPADKLTVKDIQQVARILANVKQTVADKHVRFLGDMLADRGSNDYFILQILAQLEKANLDYDILLSNHDAEFIFNFEKNSLTQLLSPSTITPKDSLEHFIQAGQQRLFDVSSMSPIIRKAYLNHIKALDFTPSDLATQSPSVLYTHAPVDLALIKKLAAQFSIPFNDETDSSIAAAVKAINHNIQIALETGQLHALFNELFTGQLKITSAQAKPLTRLIWNRDHSDLNPQATPNIRFIHGHDPKTCAENVLSLDGPLGKSLQQLNGTLPVFTGRLSAVQLSAQAVEYEFSGVDDKRQLTINLLPRTKQIGRFFVSDESSTLKFQLNGDVSEHELVKRMQDLFKYEQRPSLAILAKIFSPEYRLADIIDTEKKPHTIRSSAFKTSTRLLAT